MQGLVNAVGIGHPENQAPGFPAELRARARVVPVPISPEPGLDPSCKVIGRADVATEPASPEPLEGGGIDRSSTQNGSQELL
eukprot:2173541-Lingulodinium_polyedra.AAC.1